MDFCCKWEWGGRGGQLVLTMIHFLESSLQALPIQLALALVVELLPELLNSSISLVLRFCHLHLQLGNQVVGALHLGCSRQHRRRRRLVQGYDSIIVVQGIRDFESHSRIHVRAHSLAGAGCGDSTDVWWLVACSGSQGFKLCAQKKHCFAVNCAKKEIAGFPKD